MFSGLMLQASASAWAQVTNPPGVSSSGAVTPGHVATWVDASTIQDGGAGSGGTVTSVTFTGDGTVLSSTPSSAVTTTGTVTGALATATAKSVLGNSSASSATPSYQTSPVVSGSMTANTLVSTVTTGTAPLTVSSTTVVPNLHAATADTATTQSAGDNTTAIATDAFVTTAVNNAIAAVNPAVAVRVATAAILPNSPVYNSGASGIGATITTVTLNTALVVDGVTPVLNDRILVKNESGGLGAAKNGVYIVTQVSGVGLAWILTRALDYDAPSDINNTGAIPVVSGTANATTQWVITSSVATVGTDALTYTQFTLAPSAVFQVANNLSEGTAATMRTNLGLGTAATVNTGTSGATIPLLNGANTFSGGLTTTSGRVLTGRAVTAAGAITVTSADDFICVNKASGAATTVNFEASPTTWQRHVVKDCKGDAATNNITVTPNAGNIDGASTFVIRTNYGSSSFTYNGTAWSVY